MSFYFVSSLLSAGINFLLAILSFTYKPIDLTKRLFGLTCASLFCWILWDLFSLLLPQSGGPSSLIIARTLYFFSVFIAAFYAFFIASATRSKMSAPLRFLFIILTLIIAGSVFTDYFIPGLKREALPYNTVRLGVEGGAFYFLFIGLYYFSGIYGLFKIIYAYPNSRGEFRNQLNYLLLATLVAFSASFVYFPSLFGVEIPPVDNLILSFYTMLIFYAITKHELMDIRVAISRSAAYSSVGVLIVASFAALYLFPLNVPLALMIGAALALFWAWAAHRLRGFIQTPLEEKWIPGCYNSDKLINGIARKLVPVLERGEVFKIIADELKSAVKIKNIEIITDKQKVAATDLTQTKPGLVMPLSSSEGVEGALILEQKISEDPYSEQDLTIFRTIMVQALAILDRIRPYEKIKHEFEANQKKLYDTERLLARSEKIASMAHLIQEYNHEIRTPLAIMSSKILALPDDCRKISDFKEVKEYFQKQISRASDIVDNTLRLSKPKERHETDVDLNEVIEGALAFYQPIGADLVKALNSLPVIKGDFEDLKLVFINLVKNAREAIPDKGTITIKTSAAREDNAPIVVAEISDTGIGIPKENQDKIFEPFFSTHVTKGRGLGLSIVFRIIREHLGSIEVKSQPGQGATFVLKFPAKA
ncbi:hypothetical protein A2625_01860 [candidate division WOR-1 bacterium RIFCSPHIGHO2_01_FULL_53_15]|uniref:histidine kinase n=1 Tax=candidate division WOR-1 bacterium RIFCSPHIGHO2_01_FULL_53_15 TaxID=1802564 RepID=A0A1F4Q1Z3_UNCSA|nr:MAG: hypothetical protein A2625_01860 [candidate division WOR-1 bacterium RIFCSPHIGHO2_01_FULL_53_15]OGC13604.1 MAG: hypothetical protein A3D23_06145 [candidate division WOR-1 bacterium RIFCSPHIGHO2_02_FULL_53_26]